MSKKTKHTQREKEKKNKRSRSLKKTKRNKHWDAIYSMHSFKSMKENSMICICMEKEKHTKTKRLVYTKLSFKKSKFGLA